MRFVELVDGVRVDAEASTFTGAGDGVSLACAFRLNANLDLGTEDALRDSSESSIAFNC